MFTQQIQGNVNQKGILCANRFLLVQNCSLRIAPERSKSKIYFLKSGAYDPGNRKDQSRTVYGRILFHSPQALHDDLRLTFGSPLLPPGYVPCPQAGAFNLRLQLRTHLRRAFENFQRIRTLIPYPLGFIGVNRIYPDRKRIKTNFHYGQNPRFTSVSQDGNRELTSRKKLFNNCRFVI